jgi:hypothetical protein
MHPPKQKTAEDLEYSELLDEAAALPPGSPERLLRVAAFAVSPYSSTPGRTTKPFNPLLGETFEFVCPEKGFRWGWQGGVGPPPCATALPGFVSPKHSLFFSSGVLMMSVLLLLSG